MKKDILMGAEFVYSGKLKCTLKKYSCNLKLYIEEPLPDLHYVICSLLAIQENGAYDKRSLGIMLGFSLMDSQPDSYYDKSEDLLFSDFLNEVAKEHLIVISEDTVYLTNLGRISIENGLLYHFFNGRQSIFEHLTFSYPYPEAFTMFPFYKDMGIYTELHLGAQFWPDDKDVDDIIGKEPDDLITRIHNHSNDWNNIYEASISELYEFDTRKIDIALYQKDGEYLPIVKNGENVAILATQLFDFEENALLRENAILECLFSKLWDDKSAELNCDALEPYLELVDYEELTKDSRTVWNDTRLFRQIVDMANKNCWQNISNNCDIRVLYGYLSEFEDYLNWESVTSRTEDDFLESNFNNYPWDLENISNDESREIELVQRLIVAQGAYTDEWDWQALEDRLEKEFVLSHLNLVNVNLSRYTEDTELVHDCIISSPERKWDWKIVETEFSLDFIESNFEIIEPYLSLTLLFDRIFKDGELSNRFLHDNLFISIIENNVNNEGALSSQTFNNSDYIWSDEAIQFFSRLNLITWETTSYTKGFECNPFLVWNHDFFSKYYDHIVSDAGRSHVSAVIEDANIIISFPDFAWDWKELSGNENVDTEFIKANLWLSWDWEVLTPRMFSFLKPKNIGHSAFVDKWDWHFLSENLPEDFLQENLSKYADKWDWIEVLDRILPEARKMDISWLTLIADAISKVHDKTIRESAWSYITEGYSYGELKSIILQTHHIPTFMWDMSLLYNKPEFNFIVDTEELKNILDWESLSYSPDLDGKIAFNPASGLRESAWNKDIKDFISRYEDKWDFSGLSTFVNLNTKEWFLTKYARRLDWEYISLHSTIFCEQDKEKLNNLITAYRRFISFPSLSERKDINIVQIVKGFPDAAFDYNSLIANGIFRIKMEDVEAQPDYNWDWKLLSAADTFIPKAQFLLKHIDEDWDWPLLTQRNLPDVWSFKPLLYAMAKKPHIKDTADWGAITRKKNFPADKDLLVLVQDKNVDWPAISSNSGIMNLLDIFADDLDWSIVSCNPFFDADNIDILSEYGDDINWNILCSRDNFHFTWEILERFTDRVDWSMASVSEDLDFNVSLVEKYAGYWEWSKLLKNKAFYNKVDIRDKGHLRNENIVTFIQSFPNIPRAYHFTHMSNAVKIIQRHMLQSRNKADGSFENSAGANVSITDKAHGFARFYFAPKSPTQFYNECLGKDSSMSYYKQAFENGLPKCPMPVFFVIDIEELLTKYPDKCYYSNGNMQKRNTRAFKVIDDPDHIDGHGVYTRDKDARQQEFLFEDELDLLGLNSLKIICYDDYQKDMLVKLVGTSPLKSRIITTDAVFEKKNRELFFKDHDGFLNISTDYVDGFEFRVEYSGTTAPEVTNKGDVLREKGNNIYIIHSINIKKDKPFRIYFEVSNPRKNSWLIYTNN